jgi:hypothetical protein
MIVAASVAEQAGDVETFVPTSASAIICLSTTQALDLLVLGQDQLLSHQPSFRE